MLSTEQIQRGIADATVVRVEECTADDSHVLGHLSHPGPAQSAWAACCRIQEIVQLTDP